MDFLRIKVKSGTTLMFDLNYLGSLLTFMAFMELIIRYLIYATNRVGNHCTLCIILIQEIQAVSSKSLLNPLLMPTLSTVASD